MKLIRILIGIIALSLSPAIAHAANWYGPYYSDTLHGDVVMTPAAGYRCFLTFIEVSQLPDNGVQFWVEPRSSDQHWHLTTFQSAIAYCVDTVSFGSSYLAYEIAYGNWCAPGTLCVGKTGLPWNTAGCMLSMVQAHLVSDVFHSEFQVWGDGSQQYPQWTMLDFDPAPWGSQMDVSCDMWTNPLYDPSWLIWVSGSNPTNTLVSRNVGICGISGMLGRWSNNTTCDLEQDDNGGTATLTGDIVESQCNITCESFGVP